MSALYPQSASGIRPTNTNGSLSLSQVAKTHNQHRIRDFIDHSIFPKDLVATKHTISITIDSGACDAVCPPNVFFVQYPP